METEEICLDFSKIVTISSFFVFFVVHLLLLLLFFVVVLCCVVFAFCFFLLFPKKQIACSIIPTCLSQSGPFVVAHAS